jgi:hypothetical protein
MRNEIVTICITASGRKAGIFQEKIHPFIQNTSDNSELLPL